MQIMAFPFVLIVFGGIISLAAIADPHHKRSAPRVGFTMFYAGLFSVILSCGFGAIVNALSSVKYEGVGLLSGYLLGTCGGALVGYRLALRHKRHLINSASEVDHGNDLDEG
jgi:hypothetical protein